MQHFEVAVCLYDFIPQRDSDLMFNAGENILVERRREEDNWWYGSIGERRGWFPKNYVTI